MGMYGDVQEYTVLYGVYGCCWLCMECMVMCRDVW